MNAIEEINMLVKRAANEVQGANGYDVAAARERERQRRIENGNRMRERIARGVNSYNPGDIWQTAKSIAREVPKAIPYAAARLNQSFSNVASEAVPSVVELFSKEKADKVRDFQDKYTPLGAFSRWTANGVKELGQEYLEDVASEWAEKSDDDWGRITEDFKADLENGEGLASLGEIGLSLPVYNKMFRPLEAAIGKTARLSKYIPIVGKVLPKVVSAGGKWFTWGGHQIASQASGDMERQRNIQQNIQQNVESFVNAQPVSGNADFWPSGSPRRQGEVSDPYATAHQQMQLRSYGE